jgi:hypothetical protein
MTLGAESAEAQNVFQSSCSPNHSGTGKSWEADLVKRNKGLEKFHWSQMNPATHNRTALATASTRGASGLYGHLNQHTKPLVISTWSRSRPNNPAPQSENTSMAQSQGNAAIGPRQEYVVKSYRDLENKSSLNMRSYPEVQVGQANMPPAQFLGQVWHY